MIFSTVVGLGLVAAVFWTMQTSSKEAQDGLSELATRLSEVDRRKEEFLATLAHELRNPLAPIKNAVQLMGLLKLDPEIDKLRQMMARQVEQLVRLIDDLLDVSRISRGKIVLRHEPVDLSAVIAAAVESSATYIAESGQQLIVNSLDGDPIYVSGDPSRLTQVVSNLLNNFAKYSNAGCRIELTTTLEVYKHMNEERQHMFKFLKFINDRGGHALVQAIEAPPADPKDMGDCLRKTLQHEIDNSKSIDEIVNLAHEEKDWVTFSFGQWFVKEQIEEETLVTNLLDQYDIATDQKRENVNLYALDRDFAKAPQEAVIPREQEL